MDLTYEYEDKLTDEWTLTEQKSIERSLKTIASTTRGTAPFLRDMGLEVAFPPDDSIGKKNGYITDLISQLSDWEERVDVSEAEFIDDEHIKVVINGRS